MLATLAVAFIVTPWIALRLLAGHVGGTAVTGAQDAPAVQRPGDSSGAETQPVTDRPSLYARLMRRLMEETRTRRLFYAGVVGLLVLSVGLVAVRLVQVKMLPFDNKSEFQVILDLPEGTTLETTPPPPRRSPRTCAPCPRWSTPGVRRHRRAVQLQRPGAALLPAPRRQCRRRAGQPPAQGRARPAEPRHRGGGASGGGFDRPALRCQRQDRRDPAGTAGALDAGGRGLRRQRQRPAGGGPPGEAGLRADARRGGRGLDGGGPGSGSASRVDRARAAAAGASVEQITQTRRPGAVRRARRADRLGHRPGGHRHRAAAAAGAALLAGGAPGGGIPRRAVRSRWPGSSRWIRAPARSAITGATCGR